MAENQKGTLHQPSLSGQDRIERKKPHRIQLEIKDPVELFKESSIGNHRFSHLRILQRQLSTKDIRNTTTNKLIAVRVQEHHGVHILDHVQERLFHRNIRHGRDILDHLPLRRTKKSKTHPTILVLKDRNHPAFFDIPVIVIIYDTGTRTQTT